MVDKEQESKFENWKKRNRENKKGRKQKGKKGKIQG